MHPHPPPPPRSLRVLRYPQVSSSSKSPRSLHGYPDGLQQPLYHTCPWTFRTDFTSPQSPDHRSHNSSFDSTTNIPPDPFNGAALPSRLTSRLDEYSTPLPAPGDAQVHATHTAASCHTHYLHGPFSLVTILVPPPTAKQDRLHRTLKLFQSETVRELFNLEDTSILLIFTIYRKLR